MAPLCHALLALCAALLALLLALGLRLQWGRRHAGRGRWLHHLLYFVVTALVGLCAALLGWTRQTYAPLLLPLALLLGMPLTRPGRSGHWRLAAVCALAYAWAAWRVW